MIAYLKNLAPILAAAGYLVYAVAGGHGDLIAPAVTMVITAIAAMSGSDKAHAADRNADSAHERIDALVQGRLRRSKPFIDSEN